MKSKSSFCINCNTLKPLSEFTCHKSGYSKGKPLSYCKECNSLKSKAWYQANKEYALLQTKEYQKQHADHIKAKKREFLNNHPGYLKDYRHRTGRSKPITEDKTSALYLGVVVAETVLAREFKDTIRMPIGNPGYDFTCRKGFKIDVKSSCLYYDGMNSHWTFHIVGNQIPDFFLLAGFDNRKDLNILRIWLIPAHLINRNQSFTISTSPIPLAKWSKYERPTDNALKCCNRLKLDASEETFRFCPHNSPTSP